MPTVIVLDVSLSMACPITNTDAVEVYTRLQLAVKGINSLLDYLAVHCKLEFVALMTYSSLVDVISPFTRDFDQIKSKLSQLVELDKTCYEPILNAINSFVLREWGSSTPCQVLLITDGSPGMGPYSLKHIVQMPNIPLPFSFPGKLTALTISTPSEDLTHLEKLVELAGTESCVLRPHTYPTAVNVTSMFLSMAEENYSSFSGQLVCGNLRSKISLSPTPLPYIKPTDFEMITVSMSNIIEICGFLDLADVASPAAISRHLVLPESNTNSYSLPKINATSDSDDESADDGKSPSFCVLLHGALKVENMAALCQLGPDWFGMLYSWADSKKKSNLMLTVLEPGSNSVPWLGNLNYLGIPKNRELEPDEYFPVKPSEKRSYAQNFVVWINHASLLSDIQKIVRHARKIPDKTQHFYKELNKVRRVAISYGFIELLDRLASTLETECTCLPGGAHPDCALQLTHAASALRKVYSRDPKNNIQPMRTSFSAKDQ